MKIKEIKISNKCIKISSVDSNTKLIIVSSSVNNDVIIITEKMDGHPGVYNLSIDTMDIDNFVKNNKFFDSNNLFVCLMKEILV